MFIRKALNVTIGSRQSQLDTLFDTGSSVTLMGLSTLEERFGTAAIRALRRPRYVYVLNGTRLIISHYVDGEIEIEGHVLEERIYISKDLVKGVEVEGVLIPFPQLIIGISTMEAWGIELDVKRGEVRVRGAGVLF